MKSNFDQFAFSGNPWTTDGHYMREIEDASNPLCSTKRRERALDYVRPPQIQTQTESQSEAKTASTSVSGSMARLRYNQKLRTQKLFGLDY